MGQNSLFVNAILSGLVTMEGVLTCSASERPPFLVAYLNFARLYQSFVSPDSRLLWSRAAVDRAYIPNYWIGWTSLLSTVGIHSPTYCGSLRLGMCMVFLQVIAAARHTPPGFITMDASSRILRIFFRIFFSY